MPGELARAFTYKWGLEFSTGSDNYHLQLQASSLFLLIFSLTRVIRIPSFRDSQLPNIESSSSSRPFVLSPPDQNVLLPDHYPQSFTLPVSSIKSTHNEPLAQFKLQTARCQCGKWNSVLQLLLHHYNHRAENKTHRFTTTTKKLLSEFSVAIISQFKKPKYIKEKHRI